MVTMLVAGPVVAPAVGACALIQAMSTAGVGVGVTVIQTTAAGAATAVFGAAATGATGAAIGTAATYGAATGAAGGMIMAGGVLGTFWAASVGADGYTWDCWKPIVMDNSVDPSNGITLRDLWHHPNLQRMTIDSEGLIAENIRNERFRLSPVDVDGVLAFHATAI